MVCGIGTLLTKDHFILRRLVMAFKSSFMCLHVESISSLTDSSNSTALFRVHNDFTYTLKVGLLKSCVDYAGQGGISTPVSRSGHCGSVFSGVC